jgi:hypothetical protein
MGLSKLSISFTIAKNNMNVTESDRQIVSDYLSYLNKWDNSASLISLMKNVEMVPLKFLTGALASVKYEHDEILRNLKDGEEAPISMSNFFDIEKRNEALSKLLNGK